MPAHRPSLASLSLLLALLVALPSLAAGDAEEPKGGPVEELYKARKFAEAVEAADKLVAEKKVDPENEYWAARALRVLERFDEAAARFNGVSARFPKSPDAANADIDAEISLLGKVAGSGLSEKDRRYAAQRGQALVEVAKKHASDADARARALYIAGNAFRMAYADDEAAATYETCAGLSAADATGYPAKCRLGYGTIQARNDNVEAARAAYRDCSLQEHHDSTARKCGRSLARTELVGLPAPELEVEAWIHGPPTPLRSLRGKVVLLFFFATWCPHCKETLPTLPEYEKKFAGQPFQLMAMTNNVRGQTTEGARLFVQDPQWKIDYPVAVDANGQTTIAMEASGIPQVILIDKKGNVRWSDHPAYLKDEMIEKLLAEPGGA